MTDARWDVPADVPNEFSAAMSMRDFVQGAVFRRVRSVVKADDAVRAGRVESNDLLVIELRRLLDTLQGIGWAAEANIDALVAQLGSVIADPAVLAHSDAYVDVLDRTVAFAGAPQLGEWADRPAAATLSSELREGLAALVDRARVLDKHSSRVRWEATRDIAERCLVLSVLSREYFGSRAKGLRRRLEMIITELDVCLPGTPVAPALDALTPREAFAAGREYERALIGADTAKVEFLAGWREHRRYFKQLGISS